MIERITRRRAPAFWFEQMREPRPDGGGAIRVAIWCHTTRPRRASRQPSPRAGTKTSGEHILRCHGEASVRYAMCLDTLLTTPEE